MPCTNFWLWRYNEMVFTYELVFLRVFGIVPLACNVNMLDLGNRSENKFWRETAVKLALQVVVYYAA